MFTMIVADDEKIIRESIVECIDWESHDVKIVASCNNGVEVLDAIMDESPDIVLTDIKMPGFTGLELIEKISKMDPDVEFIILSGYKEFDFAKQAIQLGVRCYLLKPAGEDQLISAVENAKSNCQLKKNRSSLVQEQKRLSEQADDYHRQLLLYDIFVAGTDPVKAARNLNLNDNTGYLIAYFTFVEEDFLIPFAKAAYQTLSDLKIQPIVDFLYVRHSLAVIVKLSSGLSEELRNFSENVWLPGQTIRITYTSNSYDNLADGLVQLTANLMRYPKIISINRHLQLREIYNAFISFEKIQVLTQQLLSLNDLDKEEEKIKQLLRNYFFPVEDMDLLHNYGIHLLSQLIRKLPETVYHKSIYHDLLEKLSVCEDINTYREILTDHILLLLSASSDKNSIITQVKNYVEENLSDPDISLKKIAREQIHMNVDYLSRVFAKENGEKFSHYLNRRRIETAKDLLLKQNATISFVADKVGCGNNPRYFSQIFKKYTGYTPSGYIEQYANK